MQIVFGRNPVVPGDLTQLEPSIVTNSAILHDEAVAQVARIRAVARARVIAYSDKVAARRALDTRPRVVRHFAAGDMVAIWRKTKPGGIPNKRAHHRWKPGICMGSVRGNYFVAVPGSVVKVSPEQMRDATREERNAWRLVEADMRTHTVNVDDPTTRRGYDDITNDGLPPQADDQADDAEDSQVVPPAQQPRQRDDDIDDQMPVKRIRTKTKAE